MWGSFRHQVIQHIVTDPHHTLDRGRLADMGLGATETGVGTTIPPAEMSEGAGTAHTMSLIEGPTVSTGTVTRTPVEKGRPRL